LNIQFHAIYVILDAAMFNALFNAAILNALFDAAILNATEHIV
jgi:hypothetical protein